MMIRSNKKYVLATGVIIALLMTDWGKPFAPLHAHDASFDSKALARRLAAIEEKNPYRLRDLVSNGRPTLIAFQP